MTPAIKLAERARIPFQVHEYAHDPANTAYGAEAAERMGVPAERVFKTLVVQLDGKTLAVGIVPVTSSLNMKLLAKAAGAKRAEMASPPDVERATGYVLGGVSPLGQKRRLRSFVDASAERHPTIFVSAGRRGLEIELAPPDLLALTGGAFARLTQTE